VTLTGHGPGLDMYDPLEIVSRFQQITSKNNIDNLTEISLTEIVSLQLHDFLFQNIEPQIYPSCGLDFRGSHVVIGHVTILTYLPFNFL